MGWAILGTIVMGLFSFFCYLYYARNGQFDNSEETKYIVFRDSDDA